MTLKRTGGPKRRTPLKRGGRLRARSEKRAAEMPTRRAMYAEYRAEHGNKCGWPRCSAEWVDLHEVLTRGRGGSHIDERVVLGLCRRHNEQATDTRSAECAGVVIPSWAGDDRLNESLTAAEYTREKIRQGDPQPCPWRRAGEPCMSSDLTQARRCDILAG